MKHAGQIQIMEHCKSKYCIFLSLLVVVFTGILVWDQYVYQLIPLATFVEYSKRNGTAQFEFILPKSSRKMNDTGGKVNFTKIHKRPVNQELTRDLFLQFNRIRGRMGNWMFQYASLIGIATKTGYKPYVLDNFPLSRTFDLGKLYPKPAINSVVVHPQEEIGCFYNETFFDEIHKIGKHNVTLKGWFWSEKYFKHTEDEVRRVFTFKKTIYNQLYKHVPELLWKNRTKVGVHVRRGDKWRDESKRGLKLFNETYLKKAMTYFREKYVNKSPIYLVVTDDRAWTTKHVQGSDVIHKASDNSEEDMALLASCDHVIITMGTFGWWGGWLSKGEVIYHNYQLCSDTHNYFPSNWIPMKNDI